jgi:hypothetical protein
MNGENQFGNRVAGSLHNSDMADAVQTAENRDEAMAFSLAKKIGQLRGRDLPFDFFGRKLKIGMATNLFRENAPAVRTGQTIQTFNNTNELVAKLTTETLSLPVVFRIDHEPLSLPIIMFEEGSSVDLSRIEARQEKEQTERIIHELGEATRALQRDASVDAVIEIAGKKVMICKLSDDASNVTDYMSGGLLVINILKGIIPRLPVSFDLGERKYVLYDPEDKNSQFSEERRKLQLLKANAQEIKLQQEQLVEQIGQILSRNARALLEQNDPSVALPGQGVSREKVTESLTFGDTTYTLECSKSASGRSLSAVRTGLEGVSQGRPLSSVESAAKKVAEMISQKKNEPVRFLYAQGATKIIININLSVSKRDESKPVTNSRFNF